MSASSHPGLSDSIDELVNLRPFPAAASQLIAACEDDGATAKDIATIIRCDPSLSVRMLQIANSPLYGFSGEIRSIDHATVVLGLRTVREVAISLAVGDVFGGGHAETAQARSHLWNHSLSCGCFAGVLAQHSQLCSPDEAFLAGIVHDVGKLLLFDHNPTAYLDIWANASPSTKDLESERFGLDHTGIGRQYGEHWELPEDVTEVICFHHQPDEADFATELVSVAAAANRLCHIWQSDAPGAGLEASVVLNSIGLNLSEDQTNVLQAEAIRTAECALQVCART